MADILMSIHIAFEDGSNPYVRYGMSLKGLEKEIRKWEKHYFMRFDEKRNGIIYYTAIERGKDYADLGRE